MPLDTLKLADKLQTMGFSKEDAENQARVYAEVIDMVFDQRVASKHDIERTETKLLAKISDVDHRLSHRIDLLAVKVDNFKEEFDNKIDNLKIEIDKKIDHLNKKIDHLAKEGLETVVNKLFVRLTAVIIALFSVSITTLLHFIH